MPQPYRPGGDRRVYARLRGPLLGRVGRSRAWKPTASMAHITPSMMLSPHGGTLLR
jgi:hypothetical protein